MENYIPKVGDKVRIKKGIGWNRRGLMDFFIGKEVEIETIEGINIRFRGDDENYEKAIGCPGRWSFFASSFEPIDQPITTFKFC